MQLVHSEHSMSLYKIIFERCLGKIGVTRLDRIRNQKVRKALGQEVVMGNVEKLRKWRAKLEQMSEDMQLLTGAVQVIVQ